MSRRKPKKNKTEVKPLVIKPKYKVSAGSLISKTEPLFTAKQVDPPKVWYTNRAWQKMKKAIAICIDEVGWLGTVDVVEGGYLVTDIHVPEQIVNGTETDISADTLADLVHELDYPENLFYWGHSHVNMGVSPSQQDENQTSEYLEHNDVFIRGIYNKKGDSKVDVFEMINGMQYQSVQNGVKLDPLPENEMEEFEATVRANVKKRTYQNNYPATQNNSVVRQTGTGMGRQGGASNDKDAFRDQNKYKSNRVTTMYANPFIV